MWKDRNVLITGISGFVGSYLAKWLVDKGANVFGLVTRRSDRSLPKNIREKKISHQIKLVEGDVRDISSLGVAIDYAQPDFIFHLAAQSFVGRSFVHPVESFDINFKGTVNLLEAVRLKDINPKIVFAGSSEEYGLVFYSQQQYESVLRKYGSVFPPPLKLPELPISETNPLRPLSPYAVSKVAADFVMWEYYYTYGIRTVISRAFNHEGGGRGLSFVTSAITSQVMKLKLGEISKIILGNVNAFRDWSHVNDIIEGYGLLAEKGKEGEVYNQGSMRTNSILSYLLISLEKAGWRVKKISSFNGEKEINNPLEKDFSELFGVRFEKTKVDAMLLNGEIEYALEDKGIKIETDKGIVELEFDEARFRPSDVPILMCDNSKIKELGFKVNHSLDDIVKDQLNYFLNEENRALLRE